MPFDSYVAFKRRDGVWGDDVEIQVISEIYNRPISIFSYSTEPFRRFSEENELSGSPLLLSYHKNSHYNAIMKDGQKPMLETEPGQVEKVAIDEEPMAAGERGVQLDLIKKAIQESRQTFSQQDEDIEAAVQASLKIQHQEESKQVESSDLEAQILSQTLKASVEESEATNLASDLMAQFNEMNIRQISRADQYRASPAFQAGVNLGFSENAVCDAIEQLGNDPDLICSVLLEGQQYM